MSFSKPKTPSLPPVPAAPTEAEQAAKRTKAAQDMQVEWSRARRASETDVGGALMRQEEQERRGMSSMEKRSKAYRTLGMHGTRG
jgi:hypothetical protein